MSMDIKGYETLASVLQAAYDQAAVGKGAERHATGLPFDQQPMQTGSDLLGTDAGLAFQAVKKIREGRAFEEYDRFERELLGAIVYIAGMIIWRQRQQGSKLPAFDRSGALDEQKEPGSAAKTNNDLRGSALDQATRAFFDAANDWADMRLAAEEPATQIDDESDRQKAVQQNGNDGAVYEDPWYGAPEWARFKAQDENGEWWWFEYRPAALHSVWGQSDEGGEYCEASQGQRNPNWRDTLIERPVGQDPQE